MKRNLIALVLVGAVILAAALIAPVLGYSGGAGNRDLQASSCNAHDIASSASVTVTASKLNPAPGEQITVTASVSGSGIGSKVGVALFTALSGSTGTAPSDKGWTIVSDPSGTQFNYNEKSYTSSASYAWTLKAPSTAGTYNLYAKAYMGPGLNYKDAASGLKFTVASVAVVSAPTVQVAAPSSGASVSGAFTAAAIVTPGAGATISSVELRVDSTLVGTKTASPYSWSVNSASYTNGAHNVNITAIDNGGRKGYAQTSITVNNVAQLPPTVAITSPDPGATLTGTATVSATATPSGTATISSVTLSIDGTVVGTKTSAPFTWSVDTVTYAKGAHTALVTATDSNALKGTAQISVSVNNDLASVSIGSPANGATVRGTISVASSGTPPAGQTISSMELKVDGVSNGTDTTAPYTWNVNTNDLANGQHVYNVTSTNSGGSKSYAQISVIYNNQPISVTITSPTKSTIGGNTSVIANVTSTDEVKDVVLRIDGTVISSIVTAPFIWTIDTNQYADGGHTLNLTATNVIGLSSHVEMVVDVDNSGPVVVVTSPSDNSTIFGDASVAVSILSPVPVNEIVLSLDGAIVGNLTAEPYLWEFDSRTMSNGIHNLTVTASDANGRVNSTHLRVNLNNSAPSVNIEVPLDGTNVSGDVLIIAGVNSLQPIANATLMVDGVAVSSLNATPYVWQWNSSAAPVGQHRLQVTAVDASGGVGYGNISVSVQEIPVTIDLTIPTSSGVIDLAPTISGAEAVRNVLFILDGNVTGNVTGEPFSYSLDSTLVADGTHELNVTAITNSGQKTFKSFTLDIVNNIDGGSSGGNAPDLHLSAVDLLVIQALIVISILALALKFGHKGNGKKGSRSHNGSKPPECVVEPEANKEER